MANEGKEKETMGFIQYSNSNEILEFNKFNIIGGELVLDIV